MCPQQVVLLGVCLDGEELALQPLPLYAVPADNVTMCAVAPRRPVASSWAAPTATCTRSCTRPATAGATAAAIRWALATGARLILESVGGLMLRTILG